MRVLMLGWEFPPHISGGLGVACHGLTQGLARHGIEVTFVVPKAFGDEDADHLRLVGLSGSRKESAATASPGTSRREVTGGGDASTVVVEETAGAALHETDASGADGPGETARGRVTTVALDSLLQPYLDRSAYEDVLEAHVPDGTAPSGSDERATEHPADGAAPGFRREFPSAAVWDDVVEAIAASPASDAGSSSATFGGGYGPDLFGEVRRYAEAVADLARRESFDLVHAHDWMTWPAGAAAARIAGVPFVAHIHASEYDRSGDNPDPRVRDLEAFGLGRADRVVAVSHFTRALIGRRYGIEKDHVRVVHNAVVHKPRSEGPSAKAIPEPIVLFLGRVTFQKGPDYFLEAAKRVLSVRPEVKFVMSGSGDMLPSMIEHAAVLGIGRNVHFTGFLRGRDVERMYAQADLYVMPSVSEPFGISPLEAMELDVPTIVSRQSGVSEVLSHALKVDFWDVEDLADKMLAVLERPALRRELRKEGREEVRRMHWDMSGKRLKEVYEELMP